MIKYILNEGITSICRCVQGSHSLNRDKVDNRALKIDLCYIISHKHWLVPSNNVDWEGKMYPPNYFALFIISFCYNFLIYIFCYNLITKKLFITAVPACQRDVEETGLAYFVCDLHRWGPWRGVVGVEAMGNSTYSSSIQIRKDIGLNVWDDKHQPETKWTCPAQV